MGHVIKPLGLGINGVTSILKTGGASGNRVFHQANNWIKSPVAAIATQPLNHQILENKIQSRLTINGITITGAVEVKPHAIAVGIPIPIAT